MFFSDWRLLGRRWYVVLVGVLMTAGLCLTVPHVVHYQYEATTRFLMLPPKSPNAKTVDNPFLALGGLDIVAGVVAKTLGDKDTDREIAKLAGGTFEVAPDVTSGGPVLLITARGTTPATALATLELVSQRVPTNLAALQTTSGIGTKALISAKVITHDSKPTKILKPVLRAMIAAGGLGFAFTMLAASWLDGALLRRAERRRRADPEEDSAEAIAIGELPAMRVTTTLPAAEGRAAMDDAPRHATATRWGMH